MVWQRLGLAVGFVTCLGLGSQSASAQWNFGASPPAAPASAPPSADPNAPAQPDDPNAHVDHSAPASRGNGGPKVIIDADLSSQTVHVRFADGSEETWLISSGRPGLDTPDGHYKPQWVDPDHISKQYEDAPMPYAIFFDLQGHAFHGSYQKTFGVALSHGCIRLPIDDAKKLFDAVQVSGGEITITGKAGRGRGMLAAHHHGKSGTRWARREQPADEGYNAQSGYPSGAGYPEYRQPPSYAPPRQTFFGWGSQN
jgi:hypothetical protein